MNKTLRSYRCTFTPVDRFGAPISTESGVLPWLQLQASNAEQAARLAHASVGAPIVQVERIDPVTFSPATQADLAALDRALARDQAEHALATAEVALL